MYISITDIKLLWKPKSACPMLNLLFLLYWNVSCDECCLQTYWLQSVGIQWCMIKSELEHKEVQKSVILLLISRQNFRLKYAPCTIHILVVCTLLWCMKMLGTFWEPIKEDYFSLTLLEIICKIFVLHPQTFAPPKIKKKKKIMKIESKFLLQWDCNEKHKNKQIVNRGAGYPHCTYTYSRSPFIFIRWQ